MKVTVEVTHDDLAEMAVTPQVLQEALKLKIEGGLDVNGDLLYIYGADVSVVINDSLPLSETAPF